jgi:methylphosphotriester-DNA--protein-cysteine methyltransferase
MAQEGGVSRAVMVSATPLPQMTGATLYWDGRSGVRRMEHAKRLLAETDVPLIEIGLQVGCADQSHFTALFRTHASLTPKAYRDNTKS